jgi:hypothetical protein
MSESKLLIVLIILAGVLSFLLYRAVVNSPLPRQEHPIKKDVKSIQKPPQQGKTTEKKAKMNIEKEAFSNVKTKVKSDKKGPFEDSKEFSPDEKKRAFEEEMKAQVPPDKSTEEIFRSSMETDRMEKMAEEEKRELFLQSVGGELNEEERRARFEESMGILERK